MHLDYVVFSICSSIFILKKYSHSPFFCQNNSFVFLKKKKIFSIKKVIHLDSYLIIRKDTLLLHDVQMVIQNISRIYHRVQLNRFSFAWNCFRKLDEKCRNVPRFLIDFVMLPFFIFGSFSNSFIPFYFSR